MYVGLDLKPHPELIVGCEKVPNTRPVFLGACFIRKARSVAAEDE